MVIVDVLHDMVVLGAMRKLQSGLFFSLVFQKSVLP
jgi:hypothetical protein